MLAAFAAWELRVPYPMLDMHFFRNRRFIGAVSGASSSPSGWAARCSCSPSTSNSSSATARWRPGCAWRRSPLTVIALNFTGLGARLMPRLGTPGMIIASGMSLLAAGSPPIALLGGDGYGGMLPGLLVMGVGVALAMPAMANAIMSAIPPEKAGVGAGVNGTLAEFGQGLGVAVLGAVLNSRFVALLPLVARSRCRRRWPRRVGRRAAADQDAFASGLETSQLVGAVAVFLGGLVAAVLLRRAERADSGLGQVIVGPELPGRRGGGGAAMI